VNMCRVMTNGSFRLIHTRRSFLVVVVKIWSASMGSADEEGAWEAVWEPCW
jgi:hypothetical protein